MAAFAALGPAAPMEPALKPIQPNHSIAPPITYSTPLVFPFDFSFLYPVAIAIAKEENPETTSTAIPPAVSNPPS